MSYVLVLHFNDKVHPFQRQSLPGDGRLYPKAKTLAEAEAVAQRWLEGGYIDSVDVLEVSEALVKTVARQAPVEAPGAS
jgi:hypothetical protein